MLPVNKISSLHFATRVLPRRGHHFVRLWDPSIHNDTTDVFAGPSSAHFDNLIRTLPHLPNLTELHTSDLIGDLRAGLRRSLDEAEQLELGPDAVEVYNRMYREREKAILGLLERAESIVYPMAVPRDLLSSFERISGANLTTLEVNVLANDPHSTVDFAAVLDKFPNLESLTVHIETFDDHGALSPILGAPEDDPATLPRPPPRLRNLVLTGDSHRAQFPDSDPSSAPLLRFAHQFARTLRTLDLDIGCADYDPDGERASNTYLDDYVHDSTPLAFTEQFPHVRQLVLRDLASASATLLASIDSTTFPALKSCLCYPPPAPDKGKGNSSLDLADGVASRIPGFQVDKGFPAFESISHRLLDWHNRRRSELRPDLHIYRHTESTYPEPVRYPYSKEDPADLSERVQRTLEHLNEWFRNARDAQDADTLAQMRDMLESIDARRAVIDAWKEGAGSESKLEGA